MRTRSARGRGGRIRAFRAGPDRYITGCEVDDRGRNEKWRYAARSFFQQRLMLALDHFKSADAASDIYARSLSDVRRNPQARLSHRKIGGGDGELYEAPHLLDLFFLDVPLRIEVLNLTSDPGIEGRGVELLDTRNAIAAFPNRLPGLLRSDSDGAQQPNACNYYPTLQSSAPIM